MHVKYTRVPTMLYVLKTCWLLLLCKEVTAFHYKRCYNRGALYENEFCSDHEEIPKCVKIGSKTEVITSLTGKQYGFGEALWTEVKVQRLRGAVSVFRGLQVGWLEGGEGEEEVSLERECKAGILSLTGLVRSLIPHKSLEITE